MPKKKDTIYSSGNNTEKSILSALKDITHSDAEAYFIIWKYAPELLPNSDTIKSYEDLKNTYKNFENRTEQSFEKALFKEDVQAGVKYLLKRLDGKRDVDLLNKYYSLATDASKIAVGSKYEIGYIINRTSGVKKISFNNKKLPKDYYITMKTVDKDEDGLLTPFIITAYKAAIKRDFEISFSSEGDPASVQLQFDLLEDSDGNILDMIELTDEAI